MDRSFTRLGYCGPLFDDPPAQGNNQQQQNQQSLPNWSPEVIQAFQNLIGRNQGQTDTVAMKLFDENFQHRNTIRQHEETIKELKKKGPSEGGLVLSKEEAQQWQSYRELGTPDELRTAKTERDDLKGKVTKAEKESRIKEAAEAVGFNFDVLRDLGQQLEFQIVDRESNGEKIKVAQVKKGDSWVDLSGYAEENWRHYLPALKAGQENNEQREAQTTTGAGYRGWPPQNSGGQGETRSNDVIGAYIGSSYSVPGKKRAQERS